MFRHHYYSSDTRAGSYRCTIRVNVDALRFLSYCFFWGCHFFSTVWVVEDGYKVCYKEKMVTKSCCGGKNMIQRDVAIS